MLRLALLFALIAVAFDAAAALIARAAAFNYGQFTILAALLYAGFGIYAGQRLRWWRALIAIAISVLADATLGSAVASVLSAWVFQPWRDAAGGAALGASLNFALAAVGIAIGQRVRRKA